MQSILFIDISVIILLIVITFISRRLGEALKIAPYYRLFYCAIGIIIFASEHVQLIFNKLSLFGNGIPDIGLNALKVVAGLISTVVIYKYWNWLFNEFLRK